MPWLLINITEGMMAEIEDICYDTGLYQHAYDYIEDAINEMNSKLHKGYRYHQGGNTPKGLRLRDDIDISSIPVGLRKRDWRMK
jgi:hypothetical protein